jgi:tetratricopeptide (TPR) repeat protein
MAGHRPLDAARGTAASQVIRVLLLTFVLAGAAAAQDADPDAARLATAQRALTNQDWEQAARLGAGPAGQSAEFDFIAGMALARLERWEPARLAFEAGRRKAPGDARFPTELAGIAYKQKRQALAKRELREALRLSPADRYGNEFLGTIFLLEGNLEATLKYWNPIDEPRLGSVATVPEPRVDRRLLSRALAFNAPQVLTSDALLATNARLDALGMFRPARFELTPSTSGTYDATLHVAEKNGFGDSWIGALLSTFGGAAYSTVYPEFFNAGGQAINVSGLARWDAQKRRVALSAETPLFHNPSQRLEIFVDARNENWNLSQTFFEPGTSLSDMNVRSISGGTVLKFVPSGRWSWTAGLEIGSRSFRHAISPAPAAAPFFTDTNSASVWLGGARSLWRVPERRFTVDVNGEARAGRNFNRTLGGFGVLRGWLLAKWLPRATGDDYEMRMQVRAGGLAGHATLDELFQLGIARDDYDLWLRGHRATSAGRKGAAPLGRRYFLANWELDKSIYNAGFLKIKLGPVVDSGAIADATGLFESRAWLWDVGAQCKVQVLGSVTLVLSYGHDVHGGHNVFYPTVAR